MQTQTDVKLHPCTHHITVDFDGPHVSGSNSTHGEEAVLPLARVHCTLVEVEQPTDPPRHTRIDAQQLSCSQDKQKHPLMMTFCLLFDTMLAVLSHNPEVHPVEGEKVAGPFAL